MEKKNCVTEVQGYFDKEENLLELEIVGSPRNMFGPFHRAYTGCSRISWADFRTEGRFHTDGVLKPYGIFEQSYICEYKEKQILFFMSVERIKVIRFCKKECSDIIHQRMAICRV